MRYAWIGFHIIMVLLIVAAFGGAFSPAPSGSFARDTTSNVNAIIGLIVIWVVGAIIFRVARRFSKY